MIGGSFYGATPFLSGNDSLSCDSYDCNPVGMICDECNGKGCFYEDMDHNIITANEYEALSEQEQEYFDEVTCSKCEGLGWI